MIYIMGFAEGGTRRSCMILDHQDLEKLIAGRWTTTPDGVTDLMFSPDLLWVGDELKRLAKESGGQPLSSSMIDIVAASLDRPRRDVPANHVARKNPLIFDDDGNY